MAASLLSRVSIDIRSPAVFPPPRCQQLAGMGALRRSCKRVFSIGSFTIPAHSLHDGRGRRTRVGRRGRLRLGAGSRSNANPPNRQPKTDHRVSSEDIFTKGGRVVRTEAASTASLLPASVSTALASLPETGSSSEAKANEPVALNADIERCCAIQILAG